MIIIISVSKPFGLIVLIPSRRTMKNERLLTHKVSLQAYSLYGMKKPD